MNLNLYPIHSFNEKSSSPIDIIAELEHYFRSSALNGEDVLPRWATYSSHEE